MPCSDTSVTVGRRWDLPSVLCNAGRVRQRGCQQSATGLSNHGRTMGAPKDQILVFLVNHCAPIVYDQDAARPTLLIPAYIQ